MATAFLRALDLADHYRSDRNDVVNDFYVPCLAVATRYDRAVGYFTSRALEVVSEGLEVFKRRDGRIRLVASPHLTEEDIEDIRAGYDYRAVIAQAVVREVDPDIPRGPYQTSRLGLVGQLVAEGTLDVKIALVRGRRGMALYHEKIGVLEDAFGDLVAFTGSLNETASALLDNFESIDVFQSWRENDRLRADRMRRDFDALWAGQTPRLEVLEFPDVAKDHLITLSKSADQETTSPPDRIVIGEEGPTAGWPRLPSGLMLRGYQKNAVARWFEEDGRGVFRMATGTGKTITALAAFDQLGRQLQERRMPLVCVVVVPLLDLVEQWAGEMRPFGVSPIKCRDAAATWVPRARAALDALAARGEGCVTLVGTNATFRGEAFQQLLATGDTPLLVIADEVHHLGAEHLRTALPERARFRLALSATPERWFDPVGSDALLAYFGDILIELGLAEAIDMGALTPYLYRPVLVPLEEDEALLYAELTSKIGSMLGRADPDTVAEDSVLGQLLRRRSQVLGQAQGKVGSLASEINQRQDAWHQLVYCAEGGRPEPDGSTGERQIDQVLDLVGNHLGMTVHPFTAREDRRERRRLLQRFASGTDLRVLVSMRCLDEGVDLPDARIAYMLASSTNPRQFIQRRGRILRRAPGKQRAEVVDFVAVPPQQSGMFAVERTLFRRELARCVEFARYADNRGEALSVLRALRDYYQLLDV